MTLALDVPLPSLRSAALVTIDVQQDTLDGQPLEIGGTSKRVPSISALTAAFRGTGRPIIHVVRLYRADGSNAEPVRRRLVSGPTPLLRPGTPGRLLAPGLLEHQVELDDELLISGQPQVIGEHESILYKPQWGAFYGTRLQKLLEASRTDTIVFAGCNFPNCPRTSIYQASERDYTVVVASDGVSGLYDRGRTELTGIGVTLATTDTIIGALGNTSIRKPADS